MKNYGTVVTDTSYTDVIFITKLACMQVVNWMNVDLSSECIDYNQFERIEELKYKNSLVFS